MATIRHETIIDAPAGEVWAVVSDAGDLDSWFPGLADCTLVGDVRTVTLGSGLELEEHVVTNDAVQRRFQYRISGGLFTQHLGTVDVIALGPQRCIAVYSTDADPAPLALVIGGASADALANLKARCEADRTETGTGTGTTTTRGAD